MNPVSCRPLLGKFLNLDVSVDLVSGLGLDTSTGTVAVNTCAVDSASISLSVLDRYGSFISEHLMSQRH